ncbi:hypothetical protein [Xenorhabdus ishibashii]|uniref:Uncharacterized protein n=1 Tax=Xenorhabdus ishibashii TaxID=1034471 RepID=A0A2D0KD85_9GAMM|nr:hypothetical protein [Xenorhabdus ishibashii]PHM61388.1 hypothetical protein Xish_00514 [Xenorhabdus ishibashii]
MNNFHDNDQPSSWYGLSELKIKLRQISNESDIFANGRNRVAVDIYIQGTDSENRQVLVPDNTFWMHTWLIDYNTGEKLSWNRNEEDDFTWCYTYEPNEFTKTPKPAIASEISSFTNNKEEYGDALNLSRLTCYVYCSPEAVNETKQIAVLVVAPNEHEYSSGYGKVYDSFIQLNSKAETIYKFSNKNIAIGKEKLINDFYDKKTRFKWRQYNVSVALNLEDKYGKRYIVKLEPDDDYVNIAHQLYHEDRPFEGYSGYYAHFLWSLGKFKTVSIGKTHWFDLPIDYDLFIDIREEPNTICFTVMSVTIPNYPIVQDQWIDLTINIYDQYGNSGTFLIEPRNDNNEEKSKVHLKDI